MIDDVLAGTRAWAVVEADVLDGLARLPAESVHCVVTSVPYYGLRDYGTGTWEGGDPACEHKKVPDAVKAVATSTLDGGKKTTGHQQEGYRGECGRCGAVRVDKQIGLEDALEAYLERMVAVFREVRRVLRKDGTLWLNVGDSYAGSQVARDESSPGRVNRTIAPAKPMTPGLKPKDLMGVPWRLAFALQADGWWLRSAITWCKRAAMPESVTDRPTSATEMVFLLSRSPRYWYDAEAVKEKIGEPTRRNEEFRGVTVYKDHIADGVGNSAARPEGVSRQGPASFEGRNLRNYWLLGPEPYAEAHFATFPTEIPRRAILAGCPPKCCPACGAPWKREREPTPAYQKKLDAVKGLGDWYGRSTTTGVREQDGYKFAPKEMRVRSEYVTTGWTPGCAHGLGPIGGVVLDPFLGSGTTVLVALRHGRRGIGIELNGGYCRLARDRIVMDAPMFNGVWPEAGG